jgi:hypothetical protein
MTQLDRSLMRKTGSALEAESLTAHVDRCEMRFWIFASALLLQ